MRTTRTATNIYIRECILCLRVRLLTRTLTLSSATMVWTTAAGTSGSDKKQPVVLRPLRCLKVWSSTHERKAGFHQDLANWHCSRLFWRTVFSRALGSLPLRHLLSVLLYSNCLYVFALRRISVMQI